MMKKHISTKHTHLFWIVLIIAAPLFGACQKEEEEMNEDAFTFREIELVAASCAVQNIGEEGFVVISSQEQLTNYIPCDEISDLVNFDEEFLIAGGVNLPNYPSVLASQKIEVNNGKLHYFVNIEMGMATQPSYVSFMSAIPKEYGNMQIDLVTQIN